MKNLFFNLLLAFTFIVPMNHNTSYAEPVNFEEVKKELTPLQELAGDNNFVIQHNDITLKIGTLEFPAIFLYENEQVPYQGYLIKFNDFIGVESFVKNINKGCDILYDELLKECKRELDSCQKDCDDRVSLLLKEKDALELELKIQVKKTDSEIMKKYLWTSIGVAVGAGAGILTYELVK